MHTILFGLKRAWHSTLRVTRGALAAFGLTAARFDLLYALYALPLRSAAQSQLWRELGVSRTTVSRMLASLEDLGLVKRRLDFGDRRQRRVDLTRQGLRCIGQAVRRLIHTGAADLAVDVGLVGFRWHDDTACFVATGHTESLLGGIRQRYGDRATLHYAWHPDD
jgi:DNA-binding MarR family transcriptional regulator